MLNNKLSYWKCNKANNIINNFKKLWRHFYYHQSVVFKKSSVNVTTLASNVIIYK